MRNWKRRHQLMIDPSSPGSGIQRGRTTEASTPMGWTTLLEKKMGRGSYAQCNLKRPGNLYNDNSLLRAINISVMQICAFYTMQRL